MIWTIDLDGVVADFDRPFCTLLEKLTGKPCPYQDPELWEWPRKRGFTQKEEGAAWAYIQQHPYWWYDLPKMDGATVNFNDLRAEGHDIYFVTARHTKAVKFFSEEWLKKIFDYRTPTVLLAKKTKGLICKALHADAHIDDRPEECVDVKLCAPFTRTYVRTRPHNLVAQPYLEKLGVIPISSLDAMIARERERLNKAYLHPVEV